MVVPYLDLVGIAVDDAEADDPLVVDGYVRRWCLPTHPIRYDFGDHTHLIGILMEISVPRAIQPAVDAAHFRGKLVVLDGTRQRA
jgi:hypothetical protein